MTVNNATNRYACSNYIVAPTIAEGANFTTIAAALAAASSGDTIFLKPGTYTENITLKAGVNLTSFGGDGQQGTVIIHGKCSFSAAGTVTISNIRLQTNLDYAIAVTGLAASVVNLIDCYIDVVDNTAISFTSSSADATMYINDCKGDIDTTGIALFEHSSAGLMIMKFCDFTNSGLTVTANTVSGTGNFRPDHVNFENGLSCSSSSETLGAHLVWQNSQAQTILTTADTAYIQVQFTTLSSGASTAVQIGAGTLIELHDVFISSSNGTTIGGTGELYYTDLTFNSVASIAAGITQTLTNMKTFISAGGSGSAGEVLTSNGATTPPSWQAAGGGGGSLVQQVRASYSTISTLTPQIPLDSSIPQNTEGTEIFSLAITPTSSSSILVFNVSILCGPSGSQQYVSIALFQDSTADALYATSQYTRDNGVRGVITAQFYMTAGTTSATTFKIRIGASAGSVKVNGLFGASSAATFIIDEISA